MRCILVTCLLLLPSVAAAQTVRLTWDDCISGSPTYVKTNTCDSNIGLPSSLIVSLDPEGVLERIIGVQGVIHVRSSEATLPDWWHMETLGCRSGALVADWQVGDANPPFSCPNPWAGHSSAGGTNFMYPASGYGPNYGTMQWVVGIAGSTTIDGNVSSDWYLVRLNLLRLNTLSCGGCASPACLSLTEVRLARPAGDPEGDIILSFPETYPSPPVVAWQDCGVGLCSCATSTESHTWGQIKGLYR